MIEAYHDDFFLVGGSNIVDVRRHIVLAEGRLDMDANGVQFFPVYFDPEVNRDRMTMKQCDAPHYVKTRFPIPNFDPEAETIFYSMSRAKLFEIYFSWEDRLDGHLPMLLKFQRSVPAIVESLSRYVEGDVHSYLRQLVAAAFDIYQVPSGTSGVAKLALLARSDVINVLYPDKAAAKTGEPMLLFSKMVA